MTARYIAQALRGRRSGRGWTARCPAHEDRTPSLSIADGEHGVVVHCHTGCAQQDVIAALRSLGLWAKLERTPDERRAWARHRQEIERDLPTALCWRRGLLLVLEAILDAEKCTLTIDPRAADLLFLRSATTTIERIRGASHETLVIEYREWLAELPRECSALVWWARRRYAAERRAVLTYLGGAT